MDIQRRTIDSILRQFFEEQQATKTGLTRRRIEAVEHHLRNCVEQEAGRILVEPDLLMVAAERQFDPDNAVARTMHADDLIFILAMFVRDPWLPSDRVQRATQLRMTEKLISHLLRARLVDGYELSCPILDTRAELNRARRELKRMRQGQSAGATH